MSDQKNRLWQLLEQGQSVWLDSIRRGQIKSGELERLTEEDALRGETANPTIFEKAIDGSRDYDDQVIGLARQGLDANAIYERLATDDVRMACDVFRPIYDLTGGADGFVSLEVSPKLAYNTQGTLSEVRRFWKIVDRPNLMIKIPGTREGVPAIEQALYEGMNINITLLFAVEAYEQVAWAYVRALERRTVENLPIDRIASVASFFVSRIDVLADKQLDSRLKLEADPEKRQALEGLKGKLAIANAKVAYEQFKQIFADPRFQALKAQGARVQRPLWASTSTKNPAYRDTMYVDTLIGPDTVNTLPLETILAFKDHGTVARTVDDHVELAHDEIRRFEELGLSLQAVTDQVLVEGVQKFGESLDQLLKVIDQKHAAMEQSLPPREEASLGPFREGAQRRLAQAASDRVAGRLWARDLSLWSDRPESQEKMRDRLGWLNIAMTMRAQVGALREFADEVIAAGFKHVLLLGMGGSSLAPEVMEFTFGIAPGHPNFAVLDSTDPATIRAYLREMNPDDTLYVVSSKSGTTLETISFYKYFYGHVYEKQGERAGRSFVAITDPGTPLEKLARERGFRHIWSSPPDIGGRYSALSYFGLVPAALMGLDLARLLDSAEEMMHACEAGVPEAQNPGLWLGTVLGELYSQGRDKVTLVFSPEIARFGSWIEQLLAESTGKPSEKDGEGRGLVPIEGEPLGTPEVYGQDRILVYVRLDGTRDTMLDQAVAALQDAGQPVIHLRLKDTFALGGEFFRWEFATAVAGMYLQVNPFDEPNVAESKANTQRVLEEYEHACRLPAFDAESSSDGLTLFWNQAPGGNATLEANLRAFLDQTRARDYVALMAYLTHSPASEKALTTVRVAVRDHYHAATTVGYGPRFLHSTGQLHKGGPNEGVFIQLTCAEAKDANIPGAQYSFGVFQQAQAIGDIQALHAHGRRVLRLQLASVSDLPLVERAFVDALSLPSPKASGSGKAPRDGHGGGRAVKGTRKRALRLKAKSSKKTAAKKASPARKTTRASRSTTGRRTAGTRKGRK